MLSAKIVIPVPDKCLNPNSRSHWGKISDKKRLLRHASRCACLSVMNDNPEGVFPLDDADYCIRYYHKTMRFMDEDNILASLKAAMDGAIDAGLIKDDKDIHIKGIERFKDEEFQRVEILFRYPEKITDTCHWSAILDNKFITECGHMDVEYNKEYHNCPYCGKILFAI